MKQVEAHAKQLQAYAAAKGDARCPGLCLNGYDLDPVLKLDGGGAGVSAHELPTVVIRDVPHAVGRTRI